MNTEVGIFFNAFMQIVKTVDVKNLERFQQLCCKCNSLIKLQKITL